MDFNIELKEIGNKKRKDRNGDIVSPVRYVFEVFTDGCEIRLTAKFDDEVPDHWKEILGLVGDDIQLEITPSFRQTTLTPNTVESEVD